MEILDDDFTRQSSPEDEAAIRKLNIESYDVLKDIKNGRIALWVLAGAAIVGIAASHDVNAVIIEGLFMVVIYATSAWFVKQKPKIALIAGFGFFIVYNLLYAFIIPGSIFSGILWKAIIIFFLLKAITAALKFEKLKEKYSHYGKDLTI